MRSERLRFFSFLPHQGRVIPQMNINPDELIWQTEFGTSHLAERIEATGPAELEDILQVYEQTGRLRIEPMAE